MAFSLRQKNIRRSLTCPICQKIFAQVTIVEECYHRFCYECITKKIIEEKLHNCPVCNVDLGSAPLQKLSMDYHWQKMLEDFNERERANAETEFPKERTRPSQLSNQEMKGFDSNNQIPEPSLRTRYSKQKSIVHALSSEKANGPWRRPPTWPRRRQGENAESRNASEIVGDGSNVGHYGREEAFWFALVASDNQKCKVPLKQIPARYVRVKDGNITVSSIKKYLAHKLNLRSENEVDISLQGRPILPSLRICKLVELWLKTAAPMETKKASVGSSARDFVLALTYARRPMAS